jgi:hypothetical protein
MRWCKLNKQIYFANFHILGCTKTAVLFTLEFRQLGSVPADIGIDNMSISGGDIGQLALQCVDQPHWE